MNNLPIIEDAPIAPSEVAPHTVAPSLTYACTSVTTGAGLRVHTITTRNKTLAFAFFEQSLQMDDQPEFAATRGTFYIQFYADDSECDIVIQAALGGPR